ncbi:hypothetical protein [Moorena sp. SIO3H5]|uniref:hypothetical protein n=1 Tax=Moorena sp. SIO3H5 TaxID=2607834 RepID=UPI0013BA7D76|nr:hypothetical protein [Moorena sp. SIO3H5]NEO71550.1 hypothetical protein [Moorena sp. SIO3H5]
MSIRYATWNIEKKCIKTAIECKEIKLLKKDGSEEYIYSFQNKDLSTPFFNFIAQVILQYEIDILSIIEVPVSHLQTIKNYLITVCRSIDGTWDLQDIPCDTKGDEAIIFLYNTDKVTPSSDINGYNIYGPNVISSKGYLVEYPDKETRWVNDMTDATVENAQIPDYSTYARRACYMGFEIDGQKFSCIAYHAPRYNLRLHNQAYGLYLCANAQETEQLFKSNSHAALLASKDAILERVEERLIATTKALNNEAIYSKKITEAIKKLTEYIYEFILQGKLYYPYLESENYDTLVIKVSKVLRSRDSYSTKGKYIMGSFLSAYGLSFNRPLDSSKQTRFKNAVTCYCVTRIYLMQEIIAVASHGVVTQDNESISNNIFPIIKNGLNWDSVTRNNSTSLSLLAYNLLAYPPTIDTLPTTNTLPTLTNSYYSVSDYCNFYSLKFYNDQTSAQYPLKKRLSCSSLISGDFNLPFPEINEYNDDRYNLINNKSVYDYIQDDIVLDNERSMRVNNPVEDTNLLPEFDKKKAYNSRAFRQSNIDNILISKTNTLADKEGIGGYAWVIDLIADIYNSDKNEYRLQDLVEAAEALIRAIGIENLQGFPHKEIDTLYGAYRFCRDLISDHLPLVTDIKISNESDGSSE